MNRRTIRWMALLCALALRAGTAAQPDRPSSAESGLVLVLPASEGESLKAGIVFTGADFYRWTGVPRPEIAGLRLRGAAGHLPLQVEERDGTGRPLKQGNGRLDDDDRVAFAAELTRKPGQVVVEWHDRDAARPAVATNVQVAVKTGNTHALVLTSGELAIGIGGGGHADPALNTRLNHGRGCVTLFSWQGLMLANADAYWLNYFPHALAAGPGAPTWSAPEVVVAGPVRTLVEIHCRDYRQAKDGKEVLKADVTRYIAVWNGVPIVDVEERINYEAAGYEFKWPHGFSLPLGRDLDEADELIVTLADRPHAVAAIESKQQYQDQPWRQIYQTDAPEEGWLAWRDRAEHTGLALFYEPLSSIRQRAAWLAYRPAMHPEIAVRTTPERRFEVNLSFRDRALRCRTTYGRELRYVALRDETPGDIRTLYRLWGLPLDEAGAWPAVGAVVDRASGPPSSTRAATVREKVKP